VLHATAEPPARRREQYSKCRLDVVEAMTHRKREITPAVTSSAHGPLAVLGLKNSENMRGFAEPLSVAPRSHVPGWHRVCDLLLLQAGRRGGFC
jgi:hypothetical protein